MKTIVATFITLAAAGAALAQTASTANANPKVRYVIGLDNIKANSSGLLTFQDGVLQFKTSKAETKVPVASIDDIFIGAETTQSGGKTTESGGSSSTIVMAALSGFANGVPVAETRCPKAALGAGAS